MLCRACHISIRLNTRHAAVCHCQTMLKKPQCILSDVIPVGVETAGNQSSFRRVRLRNIPSGA